MESPAARFYRARAGGAGYSRATSPSVRTSGTVRDLLRRTERLLEIEPKLVPVFGSSPDFSTGGDPLHFGIIATNATGVGGGLLVLNWGIDNWSVTANTESTGAAPIPEPGTAVLFAAALLAVGLRRRRRG